MQIILAPTDFSPQARHSTIHAAELARTFQAKLFLFHAYMLPTPVSEVPYVMVTVDELQSDNENHLRKEAEQLEAEYGIEVEWLVTIGIPSDEIKLLTEERNIDLVVMGMKGEGGLDKIIGSTTTNVVRKIRKPVLIVPGNTPYSTIKNITFAWDIHDKVNQGVAQLLVDIAEKSGAVVHALSIQKQSEKEFAGAHETRTSFENLFTTINHEFITVTDTSVMHGINEYLHTHPSEMLVMIAHKHSFFERLFSKDHTTTMAHETKIPLLVLQHSV